MEPDNKSASVHAYLPDPCPFCMRFAARVIEHDTNRWSVICDQCEANGPGADSPERACEFWARATALEGR